jgi:hypothetical protein
MSQLSLGALGGIHLSPDTLDEQRGAWCSPPEYTAAAGVFDLDPFTNPRSTLVAHRQCMLERGDDGFGLDLRSTPGACFVNPKHCSHERDGAGICGKCGYGFAHEDTRVWIQPPYDIVLDAIAHYGHTRFTALLRLDTSTEWFEQLWSLSEVIMVPRRDRLDFVPPPGVKASSNPFPHGLYYKRAADVPRAIEQLCYPWRVQ